MRIGYVQTAPRKIAPLRREEVRLRVPVSEVTMRVLQVREQVDR